MESETGIQEIIHCLIYGLIPYLILTIWSNLFSRASYTKPKQCSHETIGKFEKDFCNEKRSLRIEINIDEVLNPHGYDPGNRHSD